MTQLPATPVQANASIAKTRGSGSPGSQTMTGSMAARGDTASGKNAGAGEFADFEVPARAAAPVQPVPAKVQKPPVMPGGPALEQLSIEGLVEAVSGQGGGQVMQPDLPEPMEKPADGGPMEQQLDGPDGDSEPALEDLALPGDTVPAGAVSGRAVVKGAIADNRLATAQLKSTVAQLLVSARETGGAQAEQASAVAGDAAAVRNTATADRAVRPTLNTAKQALERAPVAPAKRGRIQTALNARTEPRVPAPGSQAGEARTAMMARVSPDAVQLERTEIKVTVVHQETHFGSATPQNPQMSDLSLRRPGATVQSAPMPAAPASLSAGPAAPVKVLHLHLEPAELGGVVVKMNLKGQTMSVQIQPQLQQTAAMLRSDSAALNAILQAAGVLADTATVQISDPVNTSNGPGNGAFGADHSAGQSGSAQRGNTEAGDRQTAGGAREHDDAGQGAQDEQDTAGLSDGSGELYL